MHRAHGGDPSTAARAHVAWHLGGGELLPARSTDSPPSSSEYGLGCLASGSRCRDHVGIVARSHQDREQRVHARSSGSARGRCELRAVHVRSHVDRICPAAPRAAFCATAAATVELSEVRPRSCARSAHVPVRGVRDDRQHRPRNAHAPPGAAAVYNRRNPDAQHAGAAHRGIEHMSRPTISG